MRRDIKKLLKFLVMSALVIFVLDLFFGLLIEQVYDSMKTGERARAHHVIRKSKADVMIFGSSRAFLHYNPEILEDSLQMEVYNAGRPAQSILYHLSVLKMVLKRHTPEIVVLDVNENELVYEKRKYEILNSLMPYYFSEPDVKTLIDKINPGYKYFAWSRTLPYNSSIFAIAYRGLINKHSGQDVKGYIPNRNYHDALIETENNCDVVLEIDPALATALDDFITLCRERNIRLFLFTSPRFTTYECEKKDLAAVYSVIGKHPVRYVDFSSSQFYQDQVALFNDPAHMNYEGSVVYTSQVASLIKKEIGNR